jgi:hypothetical protein
MSKEVPMRFEGFSFGSIRINSTTYEHDVVIDPGAHPFFNDVCLVIVTKSARD